MLVVGVGNLLRSDDAAGVEVARRLQELGVCEVLIVEDVPENYLGPMQKAGAQTVIFCDAVDLGAEAGAFALLDIEDLAGPSISTHNASLELVARCLRDGGVERILIAAIQPQSLEWGMHISEPVKSGTIALAEHVAAVVRAGTVGEQ